MEAERMNVVAIAPWARLRVTAGYAASLPIGRFAQICRTFWLNNSVFIAYIYSQDEPVAVGTRQTSRTRGTLSAIAPPLVGMKYILKTTAIRGG